MEVSIIKTEIISTLTSFVNEIELVFDYINNEIVNKLRDLLVKLNNEETILVEFAKQTYDSLKKYESDLSYIIMSKQKIKTSDYNFLNDIILFQDILYFNVFKDENKNTKRTIVTYLYNLYMSCFILNFGIANNGDNEEFGKHLMSFVEKLQNVSKSEPSSSSNSKSTSKSHKTLRKTNYKQSPIANLGNLGGLGNLGDLGGLGNLGGLDNMVKSLMSNEQLMSIANEITQDIEHQQIDPMTLLSSMMSGKPNNQVQKLVQNVTERIENKIHSGEIDKTVLEIQAKNILNSIEKKVKDNDDTKK